MKKIKTQKKAVLFFLIFIAFLNNLSSQNNALHFDGANDKVDISNNSSLNFSITDKFSIEAWFNTTATGYRILFSNRIDTPPFTGYEFMLNSGALDFSIVSTNNSSMKVLTTNNTFNDGNWHHAVAVYRGNPNGNAVDIYVDGILQAKTIPLNTLNGTITNINLATIAARQGVTAYNFIGYIDEVRVWKKALCISEIVAKKNCQLIGNEYGLVAYYNFNQGIASSNNSTVTNLVDLSPSANTGTLTFFALNGATSNWVSSGAAVSGTCAPFGPPSITGNTALCVGQTFSTTLTVSGALTYSWSTSSTATSIVVSPTINTTYSVTAVDVNTCVTQQTVAVSLNPLPNVSANSTTLVLCRGQAATLTANGASTYTWSNNSNLTSLVITPTVTTSYTVNGTNAIGCSNSFVITQSVAICTNLQQSTINAINLLAYPNPNNGGFKITSDSNIKLKLINELGMLIKAIELNEGNNRTESLKLLNPGLYFIVSEQGAFKHRIIVNN